ncbi:unnamed protein product, partial [marine sediment metagenome]
MNILHLDSFHHHLVLKNDTFIEAKGNHDGAGWSLEIERDLAVSNAVIDKAMALGDTIK